jgi:hypothetical protein
MDKALETGKVSVAVRAVVCRKGDVYHNTGCWSNSFGKTDVT